MRCAAHYVLCFSMDLTRPAVSLLRRFARSTNCARHERLPIHRAMERRFGRWPELGLVLRAPRGPRSQVAKASECARAPAAIAPVESVQPEHAVDGVQFGWLDEFRVRNGNCEQG